MPAIPGISAPRRRRDPATEQAANRAAFRPKVTDGLLALSPQDRIALCQRFSPENLTLAQRPLVRKALLAARLHAGHTDSQIDFRR